MTVIDNIISCTLHTMVYHMRYSGAHVIHKENVAEHSYFVTLIADMIAQDIQNNHDISIDKLKVLQMALYHDTEEAYTGDLITPVKNKSKNLKKEWDKMCSVMMKEGLSHDFPEQCHIVNHVLSVHHTYEEEKYSQLENQIVKFSDGLQSLVYLLREIGFGNQHVSPILNNVMHSLVTRFSTNQYLSQYVSQIQKIVTDTLQKKHMTLKANAIQSV